MQAKYLAIRDAVEHRSPLLARRGNVWLTLCPHILGWRKDEAYVVAYTVTGPRQWVCLPLVEINYVRATDGRWLPDGLSRPPDEMELDEVAAAASGPDGPHPASETTHTAS